MIGRIVIWTFKGLREPLRLDRAERQTMMQFGLLVGILVLTACAIALFDYDHRFYDAHGVHSRLAEEGLGYLRWLMVGHVAAIAVIAIGDVVSVTIGDWLSLRRGDPSGPAPGDKM